MEYRTLGRTDLSVSLASLGTGGPSRLGQRTHADEARSQRIVRRALESGVNLIDTAANYSDSEEILGRALRGVPRQDYLLATKFSPDPNDNGEVISPEQLVASCERSLKRLQVDVIDVYQFHGVLPASYRRVVEQLFDTAEKLKQQGKIRFLGVTEYFFHDVEHAMLEQALEDDCWDTIMVKYGVLNVLAENRVLPMAAERNVGVMNMSAVRVKLTRPDELARTIAAWKEKGAIAKDALPTQDPLGFLVHGDVRSVVEAGYRFGVGHPAISTLLFGTGSLEHLEQNINTILQPPLPEDDVVKIRELFGGVAESEGDTG